MWAKVSGCPCPYHVGSVLRLDLRAALQGPPLSPGITGHGKQAGIELSGRKRLSWEASSSTHPYIFSPPLTARDGAGGDTSGYFSLCKCKVELGMEMGEGAN